MGKKSRHRSHGAQEVHDLLKGLDNLISMPQGNPKAVEDRLIKANELARKAMQFAATGVNIKKAVERFIVELEARKDIPPKMLYGVFNIVAPYDQSVATMIAGLLAARCADPDETIRRASLQQLTSLRIPSLADVMLPPVEKLLNDVSPAVRSAAALAVLKVASLVDSDTDLQRFWDKVDSMMRSDPSAEVVHACVAVTLQREHATSLVRDSQLIIDLMIRLQEYEPHQQASILALAKRYTPTEAQTSEFGHGEPGVPQVAAFMDAVEPCLFSVNAATVLAAVDALLTWAKATNNEFWYSQALQRVKKPLFALSRHPDPEVALTGLSHISLLVQQAPYGFADDYAQFFCRHSDAAYIKAQKIDVLKHLATHENQTLLVRELMEYTKDREAGTARAALQALAHIVLTVESVGLIEMLMELLSSGDPHLVSETVLVLKDIVRRYPDVAAPYAGTLLALPVSDLEPEAVPAYLWLRGEMVGQGVQESEGCEPTPYVLEDFVDRWGTLLVPARIELMYATARVALYRAPMTMPVLQKALNCGINDPELSVSDAARLILGAFSAGIGTARQMLSGSFAVLPATEESSDALHKDLMKEFNSLSVLYGRPGRTFVDRSAHKLLTVPAAMDDVTAETGAEGDAMEESQEATLLDLGPGSSEMDELNSFVGTETAANSLQDLNGSATGIDALADFGAITSAPNGGVAELSDASSTPVESIVFQPGASLTKELFSIRWAELENSNVGKRVKLPVSGEKAAALMTQEPSPFSGMHGALAGDNVQVFAEGAEGGYMYAQHASGGIVLLQYGFEQEVGKEAELVATIRSAAPNLQQAVENLWLQRVGAHLKTL